MAASYIPSGDANFLAWLQNFSSLITASPTAFGLTASDAAALASITANYATAYSNAIGGSTRGPMNVNTKDAQKANAIARARQLATIIQANPGITDAQKTALGITVRKTLPTPIPAPSTSPLLAFIAATPFQWTIRFADQLTPALRAKPFGALQIQIYVEIPAGTGTDSYPGFSEVLIGTKNPFPVNFLNNAAGKTATVSAKWVTRTGLLGPASNTLNAVVLGQP